ncbi:MAG: hypothetical protein CMK83_13675 [Pseudomonadales bacterium]|jgi:hypothetical protein|nr:hypothetical protein [Pseudomonadales bacterium]MBI27890.1 hypothetical protein [Pseudomonadales bacterium]HAU15497.1 hypothetical protein [Gammaproteobacteria bacterium]|tara:strand:+ start:7928 stop:8299 length:372 start_codon:yes stop_codon:yes gene_type:complete
MDEWESAAEILTKAKERIEQFGWQQGAANPVAVECMATAMERAFKSMDKSLVEFDHAKEALRRQIGKSYKITEQSQSNDKNLSYWGQLFVQWNDEPERKVEEVIEAFESAANLATQLSSSSDE